MNRDMGLIRRIVLRDWLKAEIQQGFPTLRSVGN